MKFIDDSKLKDGMAVEFGLISTPVMLCWKKDPLIYTELSFIIIDSLCHWFLWLAWFFFYYVKCSSASYINVENQWKSPLYKMLTASQ